MAGTKRTSPACPPGRRRAGACGRSDSNISAVGALASAPPVPGYGPPGDPRAHPRWTGRAGGSTSKPTSWLLLSRRSSDVVVTAMSLAGTRRTSASAPAMGTRRDCQPRALDAVGIGRSGRAGLGLGPSPAGLGAGRTGPGRPWGGAGPGQAGLGARQERAWPILPVTDEASLRYPEHRESGGIRDDIDPPDHRVTSTSLADAVGERGLIAPTKEPSMLTCVPRRTVGGQGPCARRPAAR